MTTTLPQIQEELQAEDKYTPFDVPSHTININEHGEIVAQGNTFKRSILFNKWLSPQCHLPYNNFIQYSSSLEPQFFREAIPLFSSKSPQIMRLNVSGHGIIHRIGLPHLIDFNLFHMLSVSVEFASPKLASENLLPRYYYNTNKGIFVLSLITEQTECEVQIKIKKILMKPARSPPRRILLILSKLRELRYKNNIWRRNFMIIEIVTITIVAGVGGGVSSVAKDQGNNFKPWLFTAIGWIVALGSLMHGFSLWNSMMIGGTSIILFELFF